MRSIFYFAMVLLLLAACKTSKLNTELLYGLWKVAYIQTPERTSHGPEMGNPQYEFTREGKRIKTLNTVPPGPPETVAFQLDKNQISYPENPKLPVVTILKLTADSLVLKSEKAEWHLYK